MKTKPTRPQTPATTASRSRPTQRRFSPLSGQPVVHRRTRHLQQRTGPGVIELRVDYGQDPGDAHWGGCPVRERWGLTQHQQLNLALEDKLAFTITAPPRTRKRQPWPRSGACRLPILLCMP